MARKSFFRERTVAEIRALNLSEAYKQKGITRRIDGLDPSEEGLIIMAQMIPGRYFGFPQVKTQADASRACLKYGDKLHLHYPLRRKQANQSPVIPLQMRSEVLSGLEGMKEEEINYVGLSSRPEFGDRTRRVFPFVNSPIGMRLFAYGETRTKGIEVNTKYQNSRRAKTDGVEVPVSIPSRKTKKPRYRFKLLHVPLIRAPENLATVQLLRPSVIVDVDGDPVGGRTEHERNMIQYGKEGDPDGKVITYQPQDVAGYLGIVKDQLTRHNMTPMEMNPFPLFSKRGAEIDRKLYNNVLIFDPTLTSKHKLRKPHLAERCILLARAIGVFGHDEIAYWEPTRDGKIKDYVWTPDGR